MTLVRHALLILALALCLTGCSNRQVLNSLTPGIGYRVTGNIAYDGIHKLTLDVYTPDGAVSSPVVVFFYGDRWERGNKAGFKFIGESLAAKGFVVVIPEIRHYPPATYKDFLGDCARALIWAHQFAPVYGGDPDKLVAMGYSAGAYDAMMLALDPDIMEAAGGRRNWMQGAIGIAGPYNFLPIVAPDLRVIFGPPDQFVQTQPVYWADTGGNPPLLLMASTADTIARESDTQELFDRVKRAQGPVEKVIYDGLSHADMLAVLAGPMRGRADVLHNVVGFVRRVTKTADPKPLPPLPDMPGS